MSLADYQNRALDVNGWQGGPLRIPCLVGPELTGTVCTGVQKLAQRWLLEFLTESGSNLAVPTRGCQFMQAMRQGRIRTTFDARQFWISSAAAIADNLTRDALPTDPLDEQLDRVELQGLDVVADGFTMTVQLISRAGTAARVLAPLTL